MRNGTRGPYPAAMVSRRTLPLLAAVLAAASCGSLHQEVGRQLLRPPQGWLAEPADVGLRSEPFAIELHADASLTGFWLPNDRAAGRTVLLLHDEQTNASAMHPYYTFLHAAGFQVLVLDPRGFGRSRGTPTMDAWLYDLPKVFEWLRARPDVDRTKLAVFGSGLGSVAAMWAAANGYASAAVFESLPSLRQLLRQGGDGGRDLFSAGMLEFAALPEDAEPVDNAPKAKVPALFVATEREPAAQRQALLAALAAYGGRGDLWALPEAGTAPNAFLVHDGEYPRHLAAWLQGALGGPAERIDAVVHSVAVPGSGTAYDIVLTAEPAAHGEPWAAEACAVLDDGSLHFVRTWLDGATATVRMALPSAPVRVAASRVFEVVGDDDQGFHRKRTALSRAAAAVAPLWPKVVALRQDALPPGERDALGAALQAAEVEEPFPPRLCAELADAFAKIGTAWSSADDATKRAAGVALLQRAVASAPAQPKLHFWPGPDATTYGYPQQAAVDAAKVRLQRLGGKTGG